MRVKGRREGGRGRGRGEREGGRGGGGGTEEGIERGSDQRREETAVVREIVVGVGGG